MVAADVRPAPVCCSPSSLWSSLAARPAAWRKKGPSPQNVGGVTVQELKVGSGATATAGKVVSAHYTGRFPDGTKFDSSYDAGLPIDFLLGAAR